MNEGDIFDICWQVSPSVGGTKVNVYELHANGSFLGGANGSSNCFTVKAVVTNSGTMGYIYQALVDGAKVAETQTSTTVHPCECSH